MSMFNKVLVVLDPTVDAQKAMARALEFASYSPCHITAFISIYDFSYEMTTMLSGEERESMRHAVIQDRALWAERYLQPLRERNISCDTKVVWHNRPFEAIVQTVVEDGYDLVIKGTHDHDTLKSIIFTPTDWHVLRKCPSPVLLVKEHAWPTQGNIVAAVNAGSARSHHQQLNEQIIQRATELARLLDSKVHLVNAYPGTPVQVAIEIPEFNPQEYNDTMRHHHREAVLELANRFDIQPDQTHVLEGMPEDVIPRIAQALDAEMVILGTIGRTGLSAAIIGNTAEHVIDRLDCDILAVKPPADTIAH